MLVLQIFMFRWPCFCLNKHKPWLELFFKLNKYSMSYSRGHWWGLIIFKSIEILESLIEYLCLKYVVHTSKCRVELFFFSISSLINFGIAYIWPIFPLYKGIWFTILSFSSKESCTLFEILIFLVGTPTSICHFFCRSVHLSRAISGTTNHLIIIFGTDV